MIGTWRINAWTAVLGAVLTASINFGRNPLDTAAYRALGAAAAFWAIGYALRVLLMQTVPRPMQVEQEEEAPGQHLDLAAQGDDLNELLLQGLRPSVGSNPSKGARVERSDSGFQPLHAPKLKSVPSDMEPDALAQAVRHLSREEE